MTQIVEAKDFKPIDENNINDLNSFLATRQGLEICSVNLADLSANYLKLLEAARNGQKNVNDLVKGSIAQRAQANNTKPVVSNPVPKAEPKAEAKPVQKDTVKPVPVQKPVSPAPSTVTPSVKPAATATPSAPVSDAKETVKPVVAPVSPAATAKTAQKPASDVKPTEAVKAPVTAKAEPAKAVATNVTVYEGSVNPGAANKNDIWYKAVEGGKAVKLTYDGTKWVE